MAFIIPWSKNIISTVTDFGLPPILLQKLLAEMFTFSLTVPDPMAV